MSNEISDMSQVAEIVRTCENLRPARKIMEEISMPEEDCACGRKVKPTGFEPLFTGALTVTNNVCPGCREGQKMDRELSRFVCVGCRKVVMRISPHTDPDGFKYLPGRTYHTEQCPACTPGLETSTIVEKVVYMKKKGKNI